MWDKITRLDALDAWAQEKYIIHSFRSPTWYKAHLTKV